MGNTVNRYRSIVHPVYSKKTGHLLIGKCGYCNSPMSYRGKEFDKCIVCENMNRWEEKDN